MGYGIPFEEEAGRMQGATAQDATIGNAAPLQRRRCVSSRDHERASPRRRCQSRRAFCWLRWRADAIIAFCDKLN